MTTIQILFDPTDTIEFKLHMCSFTHHRFLYLKFLLPVLLWLIIGTFKHWVFAFALELLSIHPLIQICLPLILAIDNVPLLCLSLAFYLALHHTTCWAPPLKDYLSHLGLHLLQSAL